MEKKIALKDVAQHIGVSVALVSYVLNGKAKEARVGTDIVKKIKKTAAELNYQPNLDTTQAHMQDRKQGYKVALKENNIRFKKEWLIEANYQYIEKDVAAKLKVLLKPLQIDSLFFATNSLAIAGLKEINKLGIKVPNDLAVISFDESNAFDFFYSSVTYVSQSLAHIGKEAVNLVINRWHNKSKRNTTVTIEARVIFRKSCAS